MNSYSQLNSSDVIVFVFAGIIVLCLLFGFIIYFLFSYKHKQRDFELLEIQKNEIDRQKILLEKTLTDLKAAQNRLIQSEKMASLGELTAGIAHEIQNPLNFVNNFSELSVDLTKEINEEVEKEPLDKNYFKELMSDLTQNQEKINIHGKRASNIVKSMLEHSRSSTGEKTVTDINALADEYLRLSYHGLRAKDKNFNSDYQLITDKNLPKIELIPQEIGRVLLNLINNAFYACTERSRSVVASTTLSHQSLAEVESSKIYTPKVTVTTELIPSLEGQGCVKINVKDNGNGIPKANLEKIFQPFFTTKPTGEGTGLGLSLAYDIVTKGHGGKIEVESLEGEGSELIITLPIQNS